MAALTDFRIDIAYDVPQCPNLFLDRQLLHTAIEFCKETLIAEPPATNATELPDELLEYAEGIAHGVKARLFVMPNKPWTQTALVDYHQREFIRAKSDAKAAYLIGDNTSPTTIKSKPLGF